MDAHSAFEAAWHLDLAASALREHALLVSHGVQSEGRETIAHNNLKFALPLLGLVFDAAPVFNDPRNAEAAE